jgi:peptidyl-prolyl cis-trans isomerase SurA
MKFSKFFFAAFLFIATISIAQPPVNDLVKSPTKQVMRQKVDGIVATIGDYIILDSDIDKILLELDASGNDVKNITRCEMIGRLMEDRLYAHHAVQDSLKVTDADVKGEMENRMTTLTEQIGSMEKMLKYYNKPSEEEFRAYLFDVLKLGKLTSEMQKKIVESVKITPEEVREFFKKIPASELPVFGDEIEVSQIVLNPKVSQTEKQKVIDKLKGFKNDVKNGSSFSSKAILYSQDPGSKSNGGYMKINRKSPLVKEFKEVAFTMGEGEVSEPFETIYGYHIVYVEKIRGQDLDIRHILIAPKVTDEAVKEAKEELNKIRSKIILRDITFADAARSSSDDKETKANGGALLNPKTMDTHFELTKMDPTLYSAVSNLKEGEISMPAADIDAMQKNIVKIITVSKRIPAHTADYANDYLRIKELALKDKQVRAIGKWSNEKIKETFIKINGEYTDCKFANNWLKKREM